MAIIAWTGLTSGIVFGVMKMIGILRVDEDTELRGLDLQKHGESAYPKVRDILKFSPNQAF